MSGHQKIREQEGRRDAEHELIRQGQAGDRDALQSLWQTNRRWVAAIVLAHRPRTIDVEDLMQDVAIKFITKVDTLRDVEAFRPWLRRIVINVCRGAARSHKHTLHLSTGPASSDDDDQRGSVNVPAADGQSADEQVALSDSARRVLHQVMSLPAEYREPLLLRSMRGMSYQQIGEVLELPVTTIETRLARARRMLREEIGEEVWSEGT